MLHIPSNFKFMARQNEGEARKRACHGAPGAVMLIHKSKRARFPLFFQWDEKRSFVWVHLLCETHSEKEKTASYQPAPDPRCLSYPSWKYTGLPVTGLAHGALATGRQREHGEYIHLFMDND